MLFESILTETRNNLAEFNFKLNNCFDPYRLEHLIKTHRAQMEYLQLLAHELVRDLEKEGD